MVLLKEISEKLDLSEKDDFIWRQKEIDIGNFTFTDYKRISKYLVGFTNKDDSNIFLLNNKNAIAIVLYQLNGTKIVDVTTWRNGIKLHKKIPKERINPKIFE